MPTSALSRDDAGATPGDPVASPADVGTSGGPPQVDDDRGRFRLGHRPELDGLRGVAVLLVVVHHTGQLLWPSRADRLAPGGFLGVDLFFALSGFLITVLLLADGDRFGRVRLGAFAGRRVRRLVPALAALLATAAVLALTDQTYEARAVRNSFVTVLTFSHNWALVDGWNVSLGYLWSVAIEAQFYLLWGIAVALAVRFGRRPVRVLAAVALLGVVSVFAWRWVRFDGGEPGFLLYLSTFARLDAPLVGALAGVVAVTGWLPAFRGRVAAVAGAVGVLAVVGAAMTVKGLDGFVQGWFTVVAFGAAVGVLAAVRADPDGHWRRVLRARWLVGAGVISYSLYLWHFVVFDVLRDHSDTWRAPVRAAVGVGVSVVLAVLSYRLIERPFLRRGTRRRDQDAANEKQRSSSDPKAYIS